MIKYFCDRCGREAKGPGVVWPILRTGKPTREYLLCPECEKEVRDFMESHRRREPRTPFRGELHVIYRAPDKEVYRVGFESGLAEYLVAYGYKMSNNYLEGDGNRHVYFYPEKG